MTLHKATGQAPERITDISSGRLLQNLRDYTTMAFVQLWQRQSIFLATTLLTAFYFDPFDAITFYVVILLCEFQDYMIARRVAKLTDDQRNAIRSAFIWVLINTVLSAGAISLYCITVANQQEVGKHFTPLFFLFAAALFAAMNNHQVLHAIVLRLAIYGVTFLYIVSKDIWQNSPPLTSDLWLQFFTVIFVMYFLIDCSIVFLKLYRRNLEQLDTLRKEHERTKAAYIIKSQFVSTVSHELRTPLTSIKGSLDLINSGALGPVPTKMKGMLEMASKNGMRLSRLINDVLDLQKIEAGQMRFRSNIVNVNDIVCESVASNQGLTRSYGVTIEEEMPNTAPLHIMGDEYRLIQVISNMISNAAKFSAVGGRVQVGCTYDAGKVRIFVRDNGIGIPEGVRDTVFDRFSQINSSDVRCVGGAGLGMNISKEIVERYNGTIDYVSKLGSGTTFFIEFNACEPEQVSPT